MNKLENTSKKKRPLIWKGKSYEKVLIIHNHDFHGAGFCALIIYALNGIRKAKAMNAIPIIDFNRDNTLYFYDSSKGESVWTYFFENVSPFKPSEIFQWLKTGEIDESQVLYIDSEKAAEEHQNDPDRLATFWAWQRPKNPEGWMKDKRTLGRSYIEEYVKPKASIQNKVEVFVNEYFNTGFIIGIHIRGTDFHYAKPTSIKSYLQRIDQLLIKMDTSDYQIFVATDQQQYLEIFKEHHGERVLSWDSVRSNNHIAPLKFNEFSGYRKGEDVLIDILLLSQCNHIIKGAAAVGELALWFCRHDHITDFAIESDFIRKQYGQLESAFSQLNIGNKRKSILIIYKLRDRTIRKVMASWVGRNLSVRYSWARRLLRH
ncbi:hypothetical protein EV198_2910 [Roseivirga ehrenbergii]|uniref:Uncharacterized protein n=1 Tax=Roseivirga ehrenbergii (strain DSM 102268 / JCM 13514 / KCTC 12282 / NCIMB 14502 / KMM 6017) TaxID=279360 RepID=A0A150XQJ5_ROSEK|nr:hypothetical protein [Roseivirga ehrenbergii]KYG81028.1 hypothetical protein MB14_14705 [Roseivirga ehrenbergii]TCL00893.1 hypothetical protein EV198_2910 [Roseivirga ehrenbergii]